MKKKEMKANATRRLKICALVCLGMLALFIVGDLAGMYQTRQQLVTPFIPDSLIEHINQTYLQHAIVSSIMLLLAVGLYLLKRYWYAILLVAITLVGNQFLG